MKTIPSLFQSLLIFLFSSLLFSVNAASLSDRAKEKRWEDQVVDSLLVGESVKLRAKEVEFLALYTRPTTDKAKGAVIIIHGIGVHPAWPEVTDPLRMQLPDHGWHTLSLQMPILANEATDVDYPPLFPEVPARIQAGVDFLKSKGITNIVLSGHSLGTVMASYYLVSSPDRAVKTFAIVSGGPGVPNATSMDNLANFNRLDNINIIDIYGSEDDPRVLKALSQRKQSARQYHKKHYHTVQIEGANHFYRDRQNELVNALNNKLDEISSQ